MRLPKRPTIRKSMDALEQLTAAERARQAELWDRILGSDRQLEGKRQKCGTRAPDMEIDTADAQAHPDDSFDGWDER
jgi:hypothetical protein